MTKTLNAKLDYIEDLQRKEDIFKIEKKKTTVSSQSYVKKIASLEEYIAKVKKELKEKDTEISNQRDLNTKTKVQMKNESLILNKRIESLQIDLEKMNAKYEFAK
jgi:hypothetical protein